MYYYVFMDEYNVVHSIMETDTERTDLAESDANYKVVDSYGEHWLGAHWNGTEWYMKQEHDVFVPVLNKYLSAEEFSSFRQQIEDSEDTEHDAIVDSFR